MCRTCKKNLNASKPCTKINIIINIKINIITNFNISLTPNQAASDVEIPLIYPFRANMDGALWASKYYFFQKFKVSS